MIVLAQSSFHTTWASLFEMELEPNSLDWNGNELEQELELELEDMKCTYISYLFIDNFLVRQVSSNVKMPNWIYM
jgi:hypothetical protein